VGLAPLPDALENLIKLQDARIKLGRAGLTTFDRTPAYYGLGVTLVTGRWSRRCAITMRVAVARGSPMMGS
jgi:hypothetical protein